MTEPAFFLRVVKEIQLFLVRIFLVEGLKNYTKGEPVYTGSTLPVCYLIQLVDILMRLPRSPWFPIFRMI